jgi:hypothetical protein
MSKLVSWGLKEGDHVFFCPPSLQRGLEGEKKRVLGFPKVSRRKREKKNRDI